MTQEQVATFVQAGITASSGLIGVLIGGRLSLAQTRESLNRTLSNQIEIEELRYRQQLNRDNIEIDRRGTAVRRALLRSLKRVRNTSRLSQTSRSTLASWERATAAFQAKMEYPDVDLLLSDTEHAALWKAADESAGAILLLRFAADGALEGMQPNPAPLRVTVDLFRESLRDALQALGATKESRKVEEERQQGISGSGIFVNSEGAVFYPDPTPGQSTIANS